jgi:hypothetical protein
VAAGLAVIIDNCYSLYQIPTADFNCCLRMIGKVDTGFPKSRARQTSQGAIAIALQ